MGGGASPVPGMDFRLLQRQRPFPPHDPSQGLSSLWLPFPLSSFRDGVFSPQDQVIFLFHLVLGRTTPLNGNLCHGNAPQIFVYAQSSFHSFRTSTFIDQSHGVTSLSASGLTMLLARTSGDELRMSQILE